MTVHNVTNTLKSLRLTAARSLKLAAAALTLCALSACDDKNEPDMPGEPLPDGHTYISVMIQTGQSASRASQWEGPTWGDFYTPEEATKFERTIDPTKVHVALYDSEGKPIANLDSDGADSDVIIRTISEQEGIYQIFFDISNLDMGKGQEYVAAIIANYNGRPDAETIDNNTFNIQTLTGAAGGQNPLDYYKGRMPMFGFIRWNYGQYADPETIDETPVIGKIELLRAVCKIEVMLGDPELYPKCADMSIDTGDAAPHLAFVKGRHINTRGHVAPAKSVWLDPTKKNTANISFQDSFFELTSNRWTSETSEHLYLPAWTADGKFYIYLPEASGLSLNPNFDALRLNVTVNYHPKDEVPRSITGTLFPSILYDQENQLYPAFTNYTRWKLVRNHIYRFVITDIANETALKYNVSVAGDREINVPTFD